MVLHTAPPARRRARGLIVLALLACLGASAIPAGASPEDRLRRIQERQDELEQRIESVDAHGDDVAGLVETLDSQRRALQDDIDALDRRIAELDADIARVKVRLTQAQKTLAVLTGELEVVLARLNHRTTVFEERAVAAYKAGPAAYAESILSSETFTDLVDRTEYYRAALDADAVLLDEIDVLRDELEAHRDEVEAEEERIAAAKLALEKDRDAIAQARARQAEDLAAKQHVIAEKRGLLADIRGHQSELEAEEARLERESAQLQSIIQQAASSTTPAYTPTGGGQLVWPAGGSITSGYGYRIHPIFGTRLLHAGVDIGAASGAAVVAADKGNVVYVGAMSGYGNVVVVDHGGGLSTLYAHLSAFSVGSGQTVGRGTQIASVGCTGYCTGPHLHFEVRINGGPVDPLPYLQ
jgi:murein DD-endopeptidase MepM/ murein hydrolase activator NlpD